MRRRNLNRQTRRAIVHLLGEYQEFLEALIDSHTLADGSTECRLDTPEQNAISAEVVTDAKRNWRTAENVILKLEGRRA